MKVPDTATTSSPGVQPVGDLGAAAGAQADLHRPRFDHAVMDDLDDGAVGLEQHGGERREHAFAPGHLDLGAGEAADDERAADR